MPVGVGVGSGVFNSSLKANVWTGARAPSYSTFPAFPAPYNINSFKFGTQVCMYMHSPLLPHPPPLNFSLHVPPPPPTPIGPTPIPTPAATSFICRWLALLTSSPSPPSRCMFPPPALPR